VPAREHVIARWCRNTNHDTLKKTTHRAAALLPLPLCSAYPSSPSQPPGQSRITLPFGSQTLPCLPPICLLAAAPQVNRCRRNCPCPAGRSQDAARSLRNRRGAARPAAPPAAVSFTQPAYPIRPGVKTDMITNQRVIASTLQGVINLPSLLLNGTFQVNPLGKPTDKVEVRAGTRARAHVPAAWPGRPRLQRAGGAWLNEREEGGRGRSVCCVLVPPKRNSRVSRGEQLQAVEGPSRAPRVARRLLVARWLACCRRRSARALRGLPDSAPS
jgi:hypothetical protein